MDSILLHHHLGLGDYIICNGLVRFLSQNNLVNLFCKTENTDNIKLMYSDNNINILSIYNDFEAELIANGDDKLVHDEFFDKNHFQYHEIIKNLLEMYLMKTTIDIQNIN